jgi:glycosyltransferase involved in cell wall biosynthesis
MKSLVIIPALNEEHSIVGVIADLRTQRVQADILVVNDGSTDRTAALAREAGVTVVSLPYNLGIGAAMQTGYRYAERNGYDLAIQFDGDGQHRADQIDALITPLLDGAADMVVGSRFLAKGLYEAEFHRFFGIKLLSAVISLLIGRRVSDPTSGFRAVKRPIIEYYSRHYPDDYPEPEALVFLHRAGFRIAEVPAVMRRRLLGSSSITLVRGLYYMVKVTLAVLVDVMRKA